MPTPTLIKRTATPNNPPADLSLQPGELAIEMADPTRLWVGVTTALDPTGRKLLLDSSTALTAPPSDTYTYGLKDGATWERALPLTGGTLSGPLGIANGQAMLEQDLLGIVHLAGRPSTTAVAGVSVVIRGGNGAQIAGEAELRAGTNTGTGSGANVTISAGAAGAAGNSNGSDIHLYPGKGAGTGVGGNIVAHLNDTAPNANFIFGGIPTTARTNAGAVWNNNGTLNIGAGGPSPIADAPVDTFAYARKDAAWAQTMTKVDIDAADALLQSQVDLLASNLLFSGTILVVTDAGDYTAASGMVDGVLPAVSAALTNKYVIVTDGGVAAAGNIPAATYAPGDWIVCDGTAWIRMPVGQTTGAVAEAPVDTFAYGRVDAAWQKVLPLTGGTVTGDIMLDGTGRITAPSGTVGGGLSLSSGNASGALGGGPIYLYGGDSATGAGGSVSARAGDGGVGGSLQMSAGMGSVAGGNVNLSGGQGGADTNGGDTFVSGGPGGSTTGKGGALFLQGGGVLFNNTAASGDVIIRPGDNLAGPAALGKVRLQRIPTVTQTDPDAIWNNGGVLNIGAGGTGMTPAPVDTLMYGMQDGIWQQAMDITGGQPPAVATAVGTPVIIMGGATNTTGAAGQGGSIVLKGGLSAATSGIGGPVNIDGGTGAAGGHVGIAAGEGTSGHGGDLNIQSGRATAALGRGGKLALYGGPSLSGTGGYVDVAGGSGGGGQRAGYVTVRGGDSSSPGGVGGDITLQAGVGAGLSGGVFINGGTGRAPDGEPGNVEIKGGNSAGSTADSGRVLILGGIAQSTAIVAAGDVEIAGGTSEAAAQLGGDLVLSPGINTVDATKHGRIFIENLPTTAQTDPNVLWNNGGALNLGAGGGGGIAPAPVDTYTYGQKDGAWSQAMPLVGGQPPEVASGPGTRVTIAAGGSAGVNLGDGGDIFIKGGAAAGTVAYGGSAELVAGDGANGGSTAIRGGNAMLDGGVGGTANIYGGTAFALNSRPGPVNVYGGNGNTITDGAKTTISGGNTSALGFKGGPLELLGGRGAGTGANGGDVTLSGGRGVVSGLTRVIGAEGDDTTSPQYASGNVEISGGASVGTGAFPAGHLTLSPGINTIDPTKNGSILIKSLPTVAPVDPVATPDVIWNNGGVLNIGAGAAAGGGMDEPTGAGAHGRTSTATWVPTLPLTGGELSAELRIMPLGQGLSVSQWGIRGDTVTGGTGKTMEMTGGAGTTGGTSRITGGQGTGGNGGQASVSGGFSDTMIGGNANIAAGDSTNGQGGATIIHGGSGLMAGGIQLLSGDASKNNGVGGSITMDGGNAPTGFGSGGPINIFAGEGAGKGGDVYLRGGRSAGPAGKTILEGGTASDAAGTPGDVTIRGGYNTIDATKRGRVIIEYLPTTAPAISGGLWRDPATNALMVVP